MDRPPEPPAYGLLIESARKNAGLSVRESARRAGISDAWWRYVVRGYQNLSGGGYGQMKGPAETVAAMAQVVGVPPGRLETEGRRPDAAAILTEKLREDRPRLTPVPDAPQAVSDSPAPDEAALREWLDILRRSDPELMQEADPVIERLLSLPHPDGGLRPFREREALVRVLLKEMSTYGRQSRPNSGTGG